jgi:hypothetical protein
VSSESTINDNIAAIHVICSDIKKLTTESNVSELQRGIAAWLFCL